MTPSLMNSNQYLIESIISFETKDQCLHVINYINRDPFAICINTSIKPSSEKLNTHDGEDQPEHKAHQ